VFTGSDTIEDVFKAYLPATPHAVLTKEPTLDPIESPTGMIEFYQMCVLSDDELRAAKGWTSQGLCGAFSDLMDMNPGHVEFDLVCCDLDPRDDETMAWGGRRARRTPGGRQESKWVLLHA